MATVTRAEKVMRRYGALAPDEVIINLWPGRSTADRGAAAVNLEATRRRTLKSFWHGGNFMILTSSHVIFLGRSRYWPVGLFWVGSAQAVGGDHVRIQLLLAELPVVEFSARRTDLSSVATSIEEARDTRWLKFAAQCGSEH